MQNHGRTGAAIPDTRGVPLPTRGSGVHVLERRPRPDPLARSPFRGKPIIEFTPQQLERAGYRAAGTGSAPRTKKAAAERTRTVDPRRVPPAEREAIADAYRAGSTIAAIVEEGGRNVRTVRMILREAGIVIDTTRRSHALTAEQIDQAVALRGEGLTVNEVAARMAAPRETIGRALRARGIHGNVSRLPKFDHAAAVADYLAGGSSVDVAAKYGVSSASILHAVKAAGHTPRQPGRNHKRAIPADEVARMVDLYVEKRLSIPAIAQQLGRGNATVRRNLLVAGVTLRDDRASNSGGGNRHPDSVLRAAGELYLTGLTRDQVAERLTIGIRAVDKGIALVGATPRPAANIAGAHTGHDTLGALRDLMAANDITAADVRSWANRTGRDCPPRGFPSRALVEDYLLNLPAERRSA
ncbi:hypothetical protein [Phycicoccus jejuensis]|uniref:hypothetical protein n=1 Tax=Phycicoccus jejuensis TaxID=367299 RepID=UPI0004C3C88E|nr:hypothetical protein [Phycicoccus jejuensis]